MKKTLAFLAILLVAFAFTAAAAEDTTFTGWVADEACAKDFAKAGNTDHKTCATACLKKGNAALALDGSLHLLDIDTETALKYAGSEVVVTGTLDDATNTIKVTSIDAKPSKE